MGTRTILLAGDKTFLKQCRLWADKNMGVDVIGQAVTPEDVYSQIDILRPQGVLVPSGEEWVQLVLALAGARRNILFFVSGSVNKATWDELTDNKIMVVPGEATKAMIAVNSALEQLPAASFHYEDTTVQIPKIEKEKVGVELVQGITVVFYSPKGGAGKTTMSTNVAAMVGMWAKVMEKQGKKFRVALLDFNSDYGNAKYSFGFSPFEDKKPRTSIEFQDLGPTAPLSAVLGCMNYHEKSNVYFLAPPQTPHERDIFNMEMANKTLDMVKRNFHFIFIDLGVAMDKRDSAIVAMDAATDIIIVLDADPDTPALMSEQINEFKSIVGGDLSRVRMIINQSKPKAGMSFAVDASKLLGIPLICQIPYASAVQESKGKGMPVVCLQGKNEFALGIARAARALLGTTTIEFPEIKSKRKFFSYIPFLKKICC